MMLKKSKTIVLSICMLFNLALLAQSKIKSNYFSLSSVKDNSNPDYGVVFVKAEKQTIVIGTIMAYGENVKGLTIQIGNGFAFKLAPSQTGSILNYIGSTLNIVVKPGETAKIEFVTASKTAAARQLFVCGEQFD